MRALVTGCAGFIGSMLTERLLDEGAAVVGVDSFEDYYDRETKETNLRTALAHPSFRLVRGDIVALAERDARGDAGPSMAELVSSVDHVYHLAAQPGVRGSWGRSFETYVHNNVLATQRLLEAAKDVGVGAFAYASSSSVYGDAAVLPMHEDAECRPFSPYGVTKLAGEHLARLYARNFGVPTVSLRFFTVYGPRQRPDMAFNKFMQAALDGRPIEVYGDGTQTRDFTFVSDIVDGLLAAPAAAPGSVMNLGGGSRVSLNEALDVFARAVGFRVAVKHLPAQAGDVPDTWASVERARDTIGFSPRVGLLEGLEREWEWMRNSG